MKYVMFTTALLLMSCGDHASTPEVATPQHDALEIIGVYVDSTSFPYGKPEIVLYKQNDKLGGTWIYGYPNPTNFKSSLYEVLTLENIHIAPNGNLTFSILWDMTQRTGRKKMYHYFTGQLQDGVIQGSFTSDSPVVRPSPIKAYKKTPAELKPNIRDYVIARQHSASEYKKSLNKIISCQEERNRLPSNPIEVIGAWLKYDSDGEHEWGYEVTLFKLGNTYRGWLEDYAGMIADGGIRYPLNDIQLNQENMSFQTPIGGFNVRYDTITQGSELELIKKGILAKEDINMHLTKITDTPTDEQVWQAYQALKIKCE